MRLHRLILAAVLIPLGACEELTGVNLDPDAPANVAYSLVPSGDPDAPLGVILTWDLPRSGRANAFNVYGRPTQNAGWALRATTTSPTFHDAGVPEAQYYVATRDDNGNEIAQSAVVTIDLVSSRLPAPLGLTSISLNSSIHLSWRSNAVDASRGTFDHYRVYSTSYDASRGVCTAGWVVEGSTVADAFFVGNLTNGISRCFAVSAVTRAGHESRWSDSRLDTPRMDARNAFVYASSVRRDSAGFVFFEDGTRRFGVVADAARNDQDFIVERRQDGSLWLTPAKTAVTMTLFSSRPVADLSSIDRAPATGFASTAVEAVPGYAYVFRIVKPDGVHFAAVRVAFVTSAYVVFDWAYQSAPGNAELNIVPTFALP
jgi:hypothetical protein